MFRALSTGGRSSNCSGRHARDLSVLNAVGFIEEPNIPGASRRRVWRMIAGSRGPLQVSRLKPFGLEARFVLRAASPWAWRSI
jgi:uncharacterized membrane-anchored protein